MSRRIVLVGQIPVLVLRYLHAHFRDCVVAILFHNALRTLLEGVDDIRWPPLSQVAVLVKLATYNMEYVP